MVRISLTSRQMRDLEQVRDIPLGTLQALSRYITSELRPSVDRRTLATALDEHLPRAQSDALERQLVSISAFRRDKGLTVEEFLASLNEAMKRDSQWPHEEMEKWAQVCPQFAELLSSEAVIIAAKAIDLSYDYAKIFKKASVITDLRPLFNDEKDEICGALVANTLRLEYFAGAEIKSDSITLDLNDLEMLRRACETAIRKSKTAKAFVSDKGKVESIIIGEDDNA